MEKTLNNGVRIETTTVKAAGFDGVQAAVLAFLLFCGLFTTSVRALDGKVAAPVEGSTREPRRRSLKDPARTSSAAMTALAACGDFGRSSCLSSSDATAYL